MHRGKRSRIAAAPRCESDTLITGWENLAPGVHRVDSVLMVLPDGAEPDYARARAYDAAAVVSVRTVRRFGPCMLSESFRADAAAA